MRGKGKNVAYAVDGVAIAGGITTLVVSGRDQCRTDDPDVFGDHTSCEIGEFGDDMVTGAAGLALIVGGLIGMVVNAALTDDPPPAVDVPAAQLRLVTLPDSCEVRIAAWRTERDPVQRTLIYSDMPEHCRAQLSSPR
jgi:hypothetical protein